MREAVGKLGCPSQRRTTGDRSEAEHQEQDELEAGERERGRAGVAGGIPRSDLDVGRPGAVSLGAARLRPIALGAVILGAAGLSSARAHT
jgi:hypothetical protein